MKKYLMACIFTLISQAVWADCSTWKLEIKNVVTKETKTYMYHLGDNRKIPIPGLTKFQCSFIVSKDPSPEKHKYMPNNIGATLRCDSTNEYEVYYVATFDTCFNGHNGLGIFDIADVDTTGKPSLYIFHFEAWP